MLTQARIKEVLHFDPLTGIFSWIKSYGRAKSGCKAGSTIHRGYIAINIDGNRYLAHRLAWLYMYGYFPHVTDHINGDTGDNSISNLREVSHSQNSWNCKKLRANNNSGLKGVGFHKATGKWRARVTINYIQYHLGSFDTPELAHEAYTKKAKELHGVFYRG